MYAGLHGLLDDVALKGFVFIIHCVIAHGGSFTPTLHYTVKFGSLKWFFY